MSLSAYLAKNYLSASTPSSHHDSDRPKKRLKKDKHATATTSLVIADDDDLQVSKTMGRGEEDADVPARYEGQVKSAEFRKKKGSAWTDITEKAGTGVAGGDGDRGGGEEADKILREAAQQDEERRREVEMEDAPAIVEEEEGGVRMESGVKAGLQTAADTKRLVEKEERERKADEKRRRKERKEEVVQETIYRDASGRRIDVDAKRLEAKQKAREEEERKKREKEEAMGDVQRGLKEERRREVDEAKFLTVARGADDEEMNEKLKEVVRWDDPMAMYMAQKQAEEAPVTAIGDSSGAGAATKKKVYQGHAPPNRYGIPPGWRWDGVDRGNGFEKEWFQARSKKARNEELSYQWQEDE